VDINPTNIKNKVYFFSVGPHSQVDYYIKILYISAFFVYTFMLQHKKSVLAKDKSEGSTFT
jgi:hypothetical protein